MNSPLSLHYRIGLLYPLVLFGSSGITISIRWLMQRKSHPSKKTAWRWLAVGIVCTALFAWGFRRVQQFPLEWPQWTETQLDILAYLEKTLDDDEFIVSDSQYIVFASGHLVPPNLADTSYKRIQANYLSVGEVIGDLFRYNVRFVAFDNSRFIRLPVFKDAITHITAEPTCFEQMRIYEVQSFQNVGAILGQIIRLRSYMVSNDSMVSGADYKLLFLWESLTAIPDEFTVFVHIIDSHRQLVAQHDGPPMMGSLPTSTWKAGNIIPDPHYITLPDDLDPGTYSVLVGMYSWPSLDRLGVQNRDGQINPIGVIELTTLEVVKAQSVDF
jgi:hypothetical protein